MTAYRKPIPVPEDIFKFIRNYNVLETSNFNLIGVVLKNRIQWGWSGNLIWVRWEDEVGRFITVLIHGIMIRSFIRVKSPKQVPTASLRFRRFWCCHSPWLKSL